MATAPASSMPPSTAEYGGDEVSALVLDPGYSSTRAGFAGEDAPKSLVPTYYGRKGSEQIKNKLALGDNAIHYSIHHPEADFHIENPMSPDSTVEDWDVARQIWEHSITSRLTGSTEEKPLAGYPLLMTEPAWNPSKAREKAIEIAMEDWGTPAFFMVKDPVAAA